MKHFNLKISSFALILVFLAGCWSDRPTSYENLNKSPSLPANPVPPDNSVNISRFATLQWTCSDPENDPLTYDVYLDYANPPQIVVAEGITVNTYSSGLLEPNARIYWKIVAKDNHSGTTTGSIWHFTTSN